MMFLKLVSIHSLIMLFLCIVSLSATQVYVGIEMLLTKEHESLLKGKRIGLITNHTAVDSKMQSSIELMKAGASEYGYTLSALFAPEHGITGASYAEEKVQDARDANGVPIYSLHGKTRRPTKEMLKKIDLLVFDIQDIGSRSYTYISTLFYAMEEAKKYNISVVVTDRPNPINGLVVDGPMLEERWRSFVGYVNVPYCHGMTIGELARFFNQECKVGCELHVIPMKGWRREMTYQDTKLSWIPTSPYIPVSTTTFYYPMLGILGELNIVNIGIGYTLPFKVVGAPWIDAQIFATKLNEQKLPGVYFQPFHYKPFYGKHAREDCQGVLVMVKDPLAFQPVTTQYVIMGILKSLYPQPFRKALEEATHRREMFAKVNGTDEIYKIFQKKDFVTWELRGFHHKERKAFMTKRKQYLFPEYTR